MKSRNDVVVVLPEGEIERLEYEAGGRDLLLDRRVRLVPLDAESDDETASRLGDLGLLDKPGVLIENPYEPGIFEPVESAAAAFAHQKLFLFSQFCGLLGARKVTALRVVEETESGTSNFEFGGKKPLFGGASAKGSTSKFDRMASSFSLDDEYAGSGIDLVAAQKLLEQHRLLRDANMRGLLSGRGGTNQMSSREVVLNVVQESDSALRTAASLSIPGYLSLDASFQRELKSRLELTVVLRVEF